MEKYVQDQRDRRRVIEDFSAANPGKSVVVPSLPAVPVFYSDDMVCDSLSYSPSASKPARVVTAWEADGQAMRIMTPKPATCEQLRRAHSDEHVSGVLFGTRHNGFGNASAAVAASLPYTVGSMIDATYEALANGIGAVSPTSGFHHAGYDTASGFCTFNGLMVAANQFPFGRIGILDFDGHPGDGTDDIIKTLRMRNRIVHYSQGYQLDSTPGVFLAGLAETIEHLFKDCDVVLYQAGADMHVDDPLGAGFLTTAQLFERDRTVFETLRGLHLPVAWNLAGGYQQPFERVIDIHRNTMTAFQEVWHG